MRYPCYMAMYVWVREDFRVGYYYYYLGGRGGGNEGELAEEFFIFLFISGRI